MKDFNSYAVKKIIMDMYIHGLGSKDSLTLMDDYQFQKEFYNKINLANHPNINEMYNIYYEESFIKASKILNI